MNWIDIVIDNLNNQEKKIHKRDLSFFQIDRIKRMANRINDFSDDCEECQNIKEDLLVMSENLSDYINDIPKGRRKLEKTDDKIKLHLKMKHNIYPVYYFVSLYSFFGMLIGSVTGIMIYFIFPEIRIVMSIGIPWFIGLLIGYFVGNKKDWVIRRNNRLL